MRNHTILLIIGFLFLTSCKDEVSPLTPDLVFDVKAYDLDNNGNSSDIRLDFAVLNNLNVTEFWLKVLVVFNYQDSQNPSL